VHQSFIRFIVFSSLVLLPFLLAAQVTNMVSDEIVKAVRNIPSNGERVVPELWALFEKPGEDPVALTDELRARLQPIKPKSELEYNMAFITLKAQIFKYGSKNLAPIRPYFDTLLRLGISSNEIWRQAHATWTYGSALFLFQQFDEAATYSLLAMQLYENLPFFDWMYVNYAGLAEILFKTEDYRPCIEYGLKALKGQDWLENNNQKIYPALLPNMIGQAYFRLGLADSAAYYYRQSKAFSAKNQSVQWVAINESFEGQLYLEKGEPEKAFSLFEKGYLVFKSVDPPMETFSLTGMGQALFYMGQTDKAKSLLWQALGAASQMDSTHRLQVAHYKKETLKTLAGLYKLVNLPDSFYYYFLEADRLEDSIVKVVSLSNLRMAETRSEVEQSRMQVAIMAEKENRSRMVRNFIIAGIVLAASVIILLLSRRNRILQLEKQVADVKQQAADAEMAAAREQLGLFTRSLHEKTQLLDQLQQQASTESNGLQMNILQDLTRQAILTEEDWQFFRNSFDKIYPGFFMRLRQAAPDITMAEQRMAALTLLKMNGREMAAILGISPESVRKTRQRLRQRLQIDAQDDLAASLLGLA
jgi:DNA-binding CsgD family transcriptional regulator/tetratricopeptide (TPR) repeat protein